MKSSLEGASGDLGECDNHRLMAGIGQDGLFDALEEMGRLSQSLNE